MDRLSWQNITSPGVRQFTCYRCDNLVAADKGWMAHTGVQGRIAYLFVCPFCQRPTLLESDGKQVPAPRFGKSVKAITDPAIQRLYDEARDCAMVGASTGAVLLCRKLLMNVAVQHGAATGLTFVGYVDFLADHGFVPPNGRAWVDQIRKKGNEATHEIPAVKYEEAHQLLTFAEMLLRFVYEFPSMLTKSPD